MYMELVVVFFKQKTAYELRISDWSSDVCSSDLGSQVGPLAAHGVDAGERLADRLRSPRQLRGLHQVHQAVVEPEGRLRLRLLPWIQPQRAHQVEPDRKSVV